MVLRSQQHRNRTALRLPVELGEAAWKCLHRFFQQLDRHRRACINDQPQTAQIVLSHIRELEQRVDHRGHELASRYTVLLDELEYLGSVEPAFPPQEDGIRHEGMPHDVVFACNVIYGEGDQDSVIVVDLQLDHACCGIHHHVSVGVQRAFWPARGPGREEHAHHIIARNSNSRLPFVTH